MKRVFKGTIAFDILCILFSITYIIKMTGGGEVNSSSIYFDLFLAVGIPMLLLLFLPFRFFTSVAYFISVFIGWVWLAEEGLGLSITNAPLISFLIPFGIAALAFFIRYSSDFLRSLIYSFWLLNIWHTLFLSDREDSLWSTFFSRDDATFAITKWWLLLLLTLIFFGIITVFKGINSGKRKPTNKPNQTIRIPVPKVGNTPKQSTQKPNIFTQGRK